MAAFAAPLAGPEFSDLLPPEVPPPEELAPTVMPPGSPHIEMRDRYEMRWAIGAAPFSGGAKAVSGGWIRLADPRPADHLLVAALTDAWMPPLFSRLQERLGVPTIDLTVHFRGAARHAAARGVVPRGVPLPDGRRRVRRGGRRGVEPRRPAAGPLPPAGHHPVAVTASATSTTTTRATIVQL